MSREEEIKELIESYRRQLHPHKLREAKQGIDTPPWVINEIKDIEAKIEKLQTELAELERKKVSPLPPNGGKNGGKKLPPILFILIGLVGVILLFLFWRTDGPPPPPPDDFTLAYDMSSKLAYIYAKMVRNEEITPKMKSYVVSPDYGGLSDTEGKRLFQLAYESGEKALSESSSITRGQLLGEAFDWVFKTCIYYRFSECKTFDGEVPNRSGREADYMVEVFTVIDDLYKRGEEIWMEE